MTDDIELLISTLCEALSGYRPRIDRAVKLLTIDQVDDLAEAFLALHNERQMQEDAKANKVEVALEKPLVLRERLGVYSVAFTDVQAKEATDRIIADAMQSAPSKPSDVALIVDCYKAVIVLHRMLNKAGLLHGVDVAQQLADRIAKVHREAVGRADLSGLVNEWPKDWPKEEVYPGHWVYVDPESLKYRKHEEPADYVAQDTIRRMKDALLVADWAIMELNGCFPLGGAPGSKQHTLREAALIVREFTGDDYKAREEGSKRVFELAMASALRESEG